MIKEMAAIDGSIQKKVHGSGVNYSTRRYE